MLGGALQDVAEYGGEMLYINKSARNPMWAMEYMRDEGARKFWDDFSPPFQKDGDGPPHKGQSAATYNRNGDSFALEAVRRWHDYWRERPGTGTRVSSGGVNIIFSDSNTHHRGAENYRRSGEVDAMRIPKDAFFAHQVMWDGWVDVERPRPHRRALELRAGDGQAGACDFQRRAGQAHAQWARPWPRAPAQPLRLHLRCGGVRSGRTESGRLRRTRPSGVRGGAAGGRADGADLALVQVEAVEAVDAGDRRNPVALDTVRFELAGPAEWRGGIAQGPGNHVLARALPLEGGVNCVLVRSTTTAGKIVLRARADGLAPAELTLASTPVAVSGGLAALPAPPPLRLERGPTPSSASFAPSRIAVPVASSTAASNGERAALSVDDDETTSWANEAGAPAQITYRLARPALLREIVVKLTGWRERSYPLRVFVDGAEVYRGTTPKNLGYVTLPLVPRHGSEVRIALEGQADDADAIRMQEVANQANADTGAQQVARSQLSIVEAEFYELP